MQKLLQGKTAVITGCSRGIGKAILETFAQHSANIWALVRTVDKEFEKYISSLAEKCGTKLTPLAMDLSNTEEVKKSAQAILASKETIDILVNNAGVIHTALFQMTPIEKMKELFEVNYFSQMLFTQYITRAMTRQKSGSIINISSSAAIEGNEGRSAYAASKSALIATTQVLSRELGAQNIRVNAIAPGLTETDMMRESTSESGLATTIARTSLKRVGRPEEIAGAALFLASDLSSFMTGQVLRVDGGM